MRLAAVFDTNVLLSGIGWGGTPERCFELARAGLVLGLTSQGILDELSEKLRARLQRSEEEIVETVADLLTFLELVPIPGTLRVIMADPDDDKVLECAMIGAATHIVTGDRRHLLPLGSY